jgi:antitoxin MazE
MTTYVQKWGNSRGIRIPKTFLEELGIREKEKLDIIILPEDKSIVIRKSQKRKTLRELFENYDGDYKCEEIEIGEPTGEEIW